MTQQFRVFAVALLAAGALFAQAPKGWKMRVDRSTSAEDPDAAGSIKFVTSGAGFHATNPQAAVYWNPANTATGNYTLKATFTLLNRSTFDINYYGLVFGGSNLDGPQQQYIYFMVGHDGTCMVKHRDGANASTVAGRMPNSAVKTEGKPVNVLEVRVGASKIDYVVNGTVVTSTPKTGATAKTDGIYGLRVNHMLEVQIDGLSVTKQ